ncbi:MAG: amidase [Bacilli bacterium]|nr:amidase [Bacilli bacterium]
MYQIVEKNILEINKALDSGQMTSRELVLQCLKRIKEIDQGEIPYNSVLEINPDALNIATFLDGERELGISRGLLHGIPVLLKDNINTFDKMHTTAGSIALQTNFANYDASFVKNLRDAGAIILGKTNLTEFANFMSYNMRNGYSSLGKEVLCPYNIETDPSGSSAGSAVSVALNLAPIAVGTETGGSIMSPAMKNGIVGIKPTLGLVSRTGIIPISSTLDTAGPMAKNVTDAAILLSVMRGFDVSDPITLEKPIDAIDYTKYLKKDSLKGARIAINRDRFDALPEANKKAFNEVIETFKKADAVIIEGLEIKQTKLIFHLMKYEFKRNINHYLSTLGTNSKMKTLNDILHYNREHHKDGLKYSQQLLEECEYNTSGRMNEQEYLDAVEERETAIKSLDELFEKHKLDLIYFANYTSLGPNCGFPTMTIPIGMDENNIPIGAYLLAQRYKEKNLIRLGYALEQILQKRVNPISK